MLSWSKRSATASHYERAAIAAGSTSDEWQPAHAALGKIVSAETGSFERLGEKTAVPG